jgi:hypothetical protein
MLAWRYRARFFSPSKPCHWDAQKPQAVYWLFMLTILT